MKLVIVRSEESKLRDAKKIEGWSDEGLSFKGLDAAQSLGKKVADLKIEFGIAYSSVLKRSEETLKIIAEAIGKPLKMRESYRLNSRHMGVLERKNEDEARYMYGEKKIDAWLKSFDSKPPELVITDERFPGNDSKYEGILKFELPLVESLKDTYERVVDYFDTEISTFLRVGESVLFVGHESTIRALIKYLENIDDEDIEYVDFKRGSILLYDLDENLKVCSKEII